MSDELEPPRPTPDFRVLVHLNAEDPIDVTDAVIDAYDVAVNSLDFGSGFLSTEQVDNLRLLGHAIGAEPLRYSTDMCSCGHQYNWHAPVRGCGGTKCKCREYQEVQR